MQQQMKIYYDKETEQMKVCEDLPYIIVKSMISTTTEIILHEESQFMMCPTNCKMFKYMNDNDNNVFQLSKMECNYSDYIEMQNKLENTEKEVILLKQELSKNEKELVNFKNDLIQQMKNEMVQLKNELSDTNKLLTKEIEKINNKSSFSVFSNLFCISI